MSVRNYLDLTTGHITENDNALLYNGHTSLSFTEYEYGYYIPVPDMDDADKVRTLSDEGFSSAFIRLLSYAAGKDCSLINLDRDGHIADELPLYDW